MTEAGVYVATEVFASVLEGAKVITVDPEACIPFIHVRSVVKSGVQRIKYSYSENQEDSIASGAVCTTSLPTVVVLSGPFSSHVQEYFCLECGLSKEDARTKAQSRDVWYGMVDGLHRLMALLELQEEKPQRWAGFRWSVLLLQGVQSLQILRAFARSQNQRQSSDKFVETTMYDLLHGLQEEAKRMRAESGGRDPTPKQLAERYSSSSERTSTSTRNFASVALRLSERVVTVMGNIMNFECPKLALSYYSGKGRSTYTESDIAQQADCRVYRNFITISSLRHSSTFLNANGNDGEDLQVYTLLRLKEISRGSWFKPVPVGTILDQFSRSAAALKEVKKFEKLIRSNVWPRGMEKLRENLLQTTVLDEDVDANEGNDVDILPPIIQLFRRCVPQKAAIFEARYFSTMEEDCVTAVPIQTRTLEKGGEQAVETNEFVAQIDDPQGQVLTQTEQVAQERPIDGHELLQKYGITCFEMPWQQYNRTLHTNTDSLFDLILTEPPRGLSTSKRKDRKGVDEFLHRREMQDFAQFAQRVLVPGGYLLLFTGAMYFREWVALLRANEFQCADYPFLVAKDSKGLQRENRVQFPQNVCDLLVMAVSRGRNPQGFEPDFNEGYKLISCAYKRKFAAMDRVPVVRSRLRYNGCRSVVCTSEKNPDLLAELMVTFSPPGAKVLDPYAGTMSTGAACLDIDRCCTLIEKDKECYAQAFKRLLGLCKSRDMSREGIRGRVERDIGNSASGGGDDSQVDGSQPSQAESKGGEHAGHGDDGNEEELFMTGTPSVDTADIKTNDPDDYAEVVSSSGGAISIPSVPSSPLERPTQCLQREDGPAKLIMEGKTVATADIAINHEPESGYRRKLHGQPLSNFEKDGEELVVVWIVRVREEFQDYRYPYNYGGVESPVRFLSEMKGGFFAWDLRAITFNE